MELSGSLRGAWEGSRWRLFRGVSMEPQRSANGAPEGPQGSPRRAAVVGEA